MGFYEDAKSFTIHLLPGITLVIMLALVLVGRSFAPDRVQITILGTTDLHGNIQPVDYYTNKPDNRGIAKIATLDQTRSQRTAKRFADRLRRHDSGFAARVVSRSQEQQAARPDDAGDEFVELRCDDCR